MKLNSSTGADYRAARLRKCARLAAAIMGLSPEQFALLVAEMDDARGVLIVTWRTEPAGRAQLAVDAAWAECGESKTVHQTVAA